jgi:prolyl oligopeptidase
VELIHGVEVHDPFRWLEDGSSEATRGWAAGQNRTTRDVLDALPQRSRLHSRLTALYAAGVAGAPRIEDDLVWSLDRWAGHDQAVLCTRPLVGPAAPEPTIVIDPVVMTGDDTTAIDWYHPSRDGRLVAYGTSAGGDERSTLRVLDVTTGEHLPESIPHTRAASVGWLPDGSAFAYTRYTGGGDYDRHVYWHRIGAAWESDVVLFDALPDQTAWPEVTVSRDSQWALIHVELGWTRTDVHLVDLESRTLTTVIEGVDAVTWLGFDEARHRLIGHTTLAADRGRVVAVDLAGDPTSLLTLVPEGDGVIEGVGVTASSMLVATSHNAVSTVTRYTSDGRDGRAIALPDVGAVAGLATSRSDDIAVLAFSGFTRPSALWRWDAESSDLAPWSDLPGAIDPDAFATEHREYQSTDGTPITLFTVEAAGTPIGADLPTLLGGYGGFAIVNGPAYSPIAVALAEDGGRFAIACIRGGAEEGEAWHRAGMREHKQQVFDDFHAAADHMVASGLTSRDRLAIRGGSNGGLLMGAAVTQRPDLCGAVVCSVPLLDMVRYHLFLIARLWIPEYGDPDVPEEFAWLYAYSPYHRVVDGTCYPATLMTTGEEDSRVDPCHARKFAARLQEATSCADRNPILVRIEPRAGHGQGKPASRQADEAADVLAFVESRIGL